MKNNISPFFDTSISKKARLSVNSVSLLNIQSINDFQKKIGKEDRSHQYLEEIFVLMELNHGKKGIGSVKLLKLTMFCLKLKEIFQDVLQ